MKKSLPSSNRFCPQTLFMYGTYNEDGTPDFGLFCWVSYYWGENLGVMAAICENKRTRDNIRRNGVFSMGLVTQAQLPIADYFGNKSGYDADKMNIDTNIEKGRALDAPVLEDCPWTYELEVDKIFKDGDAEIYLCKIRNVLAEESLCDEDVPFDERLSAVSPVSTTGARYYSWKGEFLGNWGEPKEKLK